MSKALTIEQQVIEATVSDLKLMADAYADNIGEYSMHDTDNRAPIGKSAELVEYAGRRYLVGDMYIVIAKRVQS